MEIIAKVGVALQQLLGTIAEKVATATEIIVRQRKFSGLSLARTFVLGFLQNPEASDEALAQMAITCGVDVTPQAIEQRQTPKLVAFFEHLFRQAVQVVIASDKALAEILERFTSVTLLDSTSITVPDSLKEKFPGCGGTYGRGQAGFKLQTELDLRSGASSHIEIEAGNSPDSATTRQQAQRPAGSLRITDLGYFSVSVFSALIAGGAHFLSRLQFRTGILLRNGAKVDEILRWLSQHPGPFVDVPILLGHSEQLPCRLLAWRLPPEPANRRRQKLKKESQSKYGKQPSAARLAWCDWTILVTRVPPELLSPAEAVILYRARWQVELLFKRWKSQDKVAVLSGSTEVRQMVRVWARLLAALVQHWLLIGSAWGDSKRSLSKVCEAVRKFASRIAAALEHRDALLAVIAEFCRTVAKTCKRNKRTKAGTFELLNDVSLLDFCFT
jgi:hypothetical protein